MSDKQSQFSGTKAVAESHRFDERALLAYLQENLPEPPASLSVRQFKGGQSNPTYELETPTRNYVLRRKPPGKLLPSAHAVDREFRVLSALHGCGMPVPKPYLLCEDADVIGTMFYVMERAVGEVYWQPTLPDLSRSERSQLYENMLATLARLHTLDYTALGLTDFGKPGNYFARQIGRWSKQYLASETNDIQAMNKLMDWLPKNIPDDDSHSIVHGDFRLDNLVIDPQSLEVVAILDWELSTIGHPLADFTYHLMSWQTGSFAIGPGGLLGQDLPALGIPQEADYVSRYCELTGRQDGLPDREFYAAFNFFRIAAILQGIAGRVRDGTASSAHAKKAEAAVEPLASRGWAYAAGDGES